MQPISNRRARLWAAAALLLFGLPLAVEGAVRTRQYLRHGTLAATVFRWRTDPETGLRLPEPGQVSERLTTNTVGLRGREIAVPKPADVVRIAFVGASTTFCAEVGPDESIWPELVVLGLAQRFPDRSFDLVNAGVPGFTVESSRGLFEARIGELEPDVVVVLHATNDLTLDTRQLARDAGLADLAGEEDHGPARWSLAWRLIAKNLAARRRAERARAGGGALAFDAEALAAAFGARYQELLQAARARSKCVAAVTFAHRLRRDQSPDERVAAGVTNVLYMPYLSTDAILDGYDAYNRAIADAALRTGALLIGGHETVPADARHFTDSVHLTAAGCGWMAERVLDGLLADPGFAAVVGVH